VLIGIHHAFNQQPNLIPTTNKCCQLWILRRPAPIDSESQVPTEKQAKKTTSPIPAIGKSTTEVPRIYSLFTPKT